MGYPRTIQPLIIEDNNVAKDYYEAILAGLRKEGAVVAPARFAFSYEEGKRLLEESTIYHIVILDLRLPEILGQPESPNLEFGSSLAEQCINRNAYPIPVLLVISGHLDQTRQSDLDSRVRKGIAYGRVLVKGNNEDDLRVAIQQAQRYCDIGIHICDSGEGLYPTISPRDEDLLRRCALQQAECIGLSLEWWDAKYMWSTGEFQQYKRWTKILMGRFLLDHGIGPSRPTFFKLAPTGGAEHVIQGAYILEQKLGHIKVCSDLMAGDRSLLVTQKVGDGNAPPISLATFLAKPAEQIQKAIPFIVENIIEQVAVLGDLTTDQISISNLLWPWHDKDRIRHEWGRCSPRLDDLSNRTLQGDPIELLDPTLVLDSLTANTSQVYLSWQACLHGDLNITNVALDDLATGPRAYIFDASYCVPGVNVRDLAMLEVTALLHQPDDGEQTLVQHCMALYRDNVGIPQDLDYTHGSNRARNTLKLIVELREKVLQRATLFIYALMVFDCTLIQLAGLAWHSGNKISHPADAALLASLTANWIQSIAQGSLEV